MSNDYRKNNEIKTKDIRVISDDGENLGVMDSREALKMAKDKGLDLVEIAPSANPPVTKITDFDTFRYQKEKEAKQQKKKQKSSELKHVQITPRTAKHDLETKARRANKFLEEGHRVEISMYLKGREKANKGFAKDKLQEFLDTFIEPEFKVVTRIKYTGRQFIVHITKV